ncbi:TIR domain-containing protein [Salinimicrobium sediminilitoris]|uniref:TIR domain-containing protein n=1 Tax=Salinimicrobium sediminilitoris TaxID=2876715 RepID=UPI001E53B431|nr:nucleotide-binding protein [Salinimicrobium sediminilitoris]MCC8358927.1 nucleotide-binding protein [Salinimicrobium sediminilitoris]
MNKEQALTKLEEFKRDILKLEVGCTKEEYRELRTKINKNKPLVQKIVRRTGIARFMDIAPPPMIGGFVMKSIDPFDVIFDTPYGIDITPILTDVIDQATGIIESKETFELAAAKPTIPVNSKKLSSKKVFLVHGHDNELKEKTARFLEKLGLIPIILHEQVNEGLTIIEKFEKHSDVHFAIILMTPDDIGNTKDKPGDLKPRARQNVILELGYFLGKLGRNNVCALVKDNIEIPSDYDGIVYIAVDPADGWKLLLTKEMKHSKLEFDSNKVF